MQDANTVNSLIHLYRGELGRMVSYRARLDTTTNWSIVTTAAIGTFAFGDRGVSHVVLLFALFLNYFFLHLETRRFRIYELSHQRVRVLERYFYGEMLGQPSEEGWRERLAQYLKHPQSPVNQLNALGWRIRRNYSWIYGAVLLAWLMKLSTIAPVFSLGQIVRTANIGLIPGSVVMTIVAVFYMILTVLAVRASLEHRLEMD
ncbi:MAG: DUF2270 domain-containing protein [Trueperaceae bacterium]